jgi:Rad3-related DNA helicase
MTPQIDRAALERIRNSVSPEHRSPAGYESNASNGARSNDGEVGPNADADGSGAQSGGVRVDIERAPQPPGRNVAKRGHDVIGGIWERRSEPMLSLEIGGGALCAPYLGGIVLLNAGTGAGKTSLALDIAIRHAVHRGPALVASLELPERIIGARVVGIRCDESWGVY